MQPREVVEKLERLRDLDNNNGNPEVAHTVEDDLLWEVCDLVRAGKFDAAKQIADSLQEHRETCVDRVRWYA